MMANLRAVETTDNMALLQHMLKMMVVYQYQ